MKQNVVLECLGKLFYCVRTFINQRLQTFQLEVSYFFCSLYSELSNQCSDKWCSICSKPMIRKGSIILLFIVTMSFGMFLNKSQKNSSCPFFRMKIIKLFSFSHLNIFRMLVINRIARSDDCMKESHPIACQLFYFWTDFIMNSFPEKFNAQINKLRLRVTTQ